MARVGLFVATLAALLGLNPGEGFLASSRRVSVTHEEDTTELGVLEKQLECPGFNIQFYLGNTEPVPFELVTYAFFADLRFTRSPDSELGDDVFVVLVVCEDSIHPPSTATVTVTITSVNEYAPTAPRESYSISFSEATRAGEVVATVGEGPDQYLIEDADGGEDGILTFTALNDPQNPYFSLDPPSGDLVLLRELDYEREREVGDLGEGVRVQGCDRATPTILCPNVTVNFAVTPVNDNDPQFLQSVYQVSVEEGLHRATEIKENITCTDRDIGIGGYEGMEVVSSTVGLVELTDTASGTARLLLTAALDFDFTNNTHFEVELSCYDNSKGEDQRRASARVEIEVAPANDNNPQFSVEWYNTSVLESLPVGSLLLRTSCSDRDREFGQFQSISLYQPNSAVNNTFSIDPLTGTLTLSGTLDYDNPATRSHVFSIRCSDEGGLEAISRVGISTLPVSDEPLTLLTPAFEFTVDRLTSIDTRIGQVVAIDGDQGEVPVIVYSLESNDLFEIDEEGYIVLTDDLSQDKGSFFNLSVEARDSQGAVEGQVLITATGPLSIVGVVNVVIGGVGVIVVVVIGIMVALCSYFCWKLYGGRSGGPLMEVPVNYMSGERIPYHPRPPSAHSRSSGGGRSNGRGTLRDRSTLSMKRSREKKKAHSFKGRARQRPGITDTSFASSLHRENNPSEDDLVGLNPADFEMNIFKNEDAVRAEEEEEKVPLEPESESEEEERDETTHNIFNPEDAGLMLGDIMLFPGEEQTRWGDEEDGVMGLGSWDPTGDDTLERSERSQGSESGSEEGESGEWDPRGSVEWDPNEEDDPLSFI